jgi:hypothetical protein
MGSVPQRGDFVRVRSRRWLVEDERPIDGLKTLRLACVDDDSQGEVAEVLWDAELDGSILGDEGWASVANLGTDDPSVFSAYFRTLRWNTATAADRDLFQAPFRAGIHQDAYQLLPLRKALRLPRVNLLIADDVGAGKTVEAGLVLREMLLRRRIDFVLVAAPAGMVRQWQEELDAKFGLSFTIVDREYLATLKGQHGFAKALLQRLMGNALCYEAMGPVAERPGRNTKSRLLGLADATVTGCSPFPWEESDRCLGRRNRRSS